MKRLIPSAKEQRGNARASTIRQRRQQHLLDVKVRSRKALEQRNNRIIAWVCRLVIFGALVGGVVLGSRLALKKFLWENEDFRISEINVKTDGALTRDEIMEAAGIRGGENIFRLRLNTAQEKLAKLPQVQHAEVERHLPNVINVTIEERHPVAWMTDARDDERAAGLGKLVTDAQGNVMRLERVLPEYFRLPVISGVTAGNLENGQTVNTPEVRAALQLLDLNTNNPRLRIRSIDVSKGYCLLVMDDAHAVYTFGLEHVSDQIDRLNRVFDYADFNQQRIQTANLLVQRNVPVTFVQPSDHILEAPAPASGKSPAAPAKTSGAKPKPLQKPSTSKPSPRAKEPTIRRAVPVHSPSTRHG